MVGTNLSPFSRATKMPWCLRSLTRSATQAELAKRPDPLSEQFLYEFEQTDGWLADEIKKLCELKKKMSSGEESEEVINVEDDGHVVNEDSSRSSTDGEEEDLDDIWREMAFAQESLKVTTVESSSNDVKKVEEVEDCDHYFICKDDVGEVCRVCGLIRKHISSIIEVVYNKPKKSRRTYMSEEQPDEMGRVFSEGQSSQTKIFGEKMFIHPRHYGEMKPHQIEGFKFLCNNLGADKPGGCILAHAPGSGKTFLLISFMQSFMGMDPQAKPLIVLPKGIIESWKREFTKWAVEDIPLLDFYSVKAEKRSQQMKVLGKWIKERSILFLGYQHFASILCNDNFDNVSVYCKTALLEKPTLVILDEGHSLRTKNTNIFTSLERVWTPRKVVLTGTLFQNNVEEVFNILKLVRPRFLKRFENREFITRIMSKAEIPSKRQMHHDSDHDGDFIAAVELTLQKSGDSSAIASVIKELREMTRPILHYHKADFRGVLLGLTEFTVMLNLSSTQRDEVKGLMKMDLFKQISLGVALYIHPKLKAFLEEHPSSEEKSFADNKNTLKTLDGMLKNINVRDGVKMKFFLNLLALCESKGEKLLVFSQYIFPIKTLERLMTILKGWRLGKEMFMITGDSNNEQRELSMQKFNESPDAKVFFGSIKACGEGISLVGASRVLILDVHLNPSVTQQAVARAYRPGQKRKVYAYRLVAADSPEEENYKICSRKEMMSKMWFEWNVGASRSGFELNEIDVANSGDEFLETVKLREDIKSLYQR